MSSTSCAVTDAPTLSGASVHEAFEHILLRGLVHWHYLHGTVKETKPVPGGSGSERLGRGAIVGPRLVSTNSKTTGSPATGFSVTRRLSRTTSAWAMASTVALA